MMVIYIPILPPNLDTLRLTSLANKNIQDVILFYCYIITQFVPVTSIMVAVSRCVITLKHYMLVRVIMDTCWILTYTVARVSE